MSTRESDAVTAVAAIAAICVIVIVACLAGIDDTLIKLGIGAIAGLAGFSLAGLVRRNP